MVVVWTEEAVVQFRAAYEYLLEVAGKSVAKHLVCKIEDAAEKLAEYPKMGAVEDELKHLPHGYRSFVAHKNYKIIYRIEGETVYISALFDCRQHPDKAREIK